MVTEGKHLWSIESRIASTVIRVEYKEGLRCEIKTREMMCSENTLKKTQAISLSKLCCYGLARMKKQRRRARVGDVYFTHFNHCCRVSSTLLSRRTNGVERKGRDYIFFYYIALHHAFISRRNGKACLESKSRTIECLHQCWHGYSGLQLSLLPEKRSCLSCHSQSVLSFAIFRDFRHRLWERISSYDVHATLRVWHCIR